MQPMAHSYIRFSTLEQRKGGSEKRQVDKSKKICEQQGWQLDDKLTLMDLGVSAYRGRHARTGALKGFIDAIKLGEVKTGRYLIIEKINRLTRQSFFDAIDLIK